MDVWELRNKMIPVLLDAGFSVDEIATAFRNKPSYVQQQVDWMKNAEARRRAEAERPDGIGIYELSIGIRAWNRLEGAGIVTVEQLCELSAMDLFALEGFGSKTLAEVRAALSERGVALRGDSLDVVLSCIESGTLEKQGAQPLFRL